jgi:hypothetical protein
MNLTTLLKRVLLTAWLLPAYAFATPPHLPQPDWTAPVRMSSALTQSPAANVDSTAAMHGKTRVQSAAQERDGDRADGSSQAGRPAAFDN